MKNGLQGTPIAVRSRIQLALALLVTVIWLGIYHIQSRPERWPSVEGVVLECHYLDTRAKHGGPYVHYAYEVGGRRYESRRLSQFVRPHRYIGDRTHSRSVGMAFVAAHPAGSPIEVRYDPSDPGTAVVLWTTNVLAVWLPALLVVGLWVHTGWVWIRAWSDEPAEPAAARLPRPDQRAALARTEPGAPCWREQYVRATERVDEPAKR